MIAEGEDDFLVELLDDFKDVFAADGSTRKLSGDLAYMRLTELRFLLKNARELAAIQLYQSYSRPDTCTADSDNKISVAAVDRKRLQSRLVRLDRLLSAIRSSITESFAGAELQPRILRLCRSYELTEAEVDLFHLIVVVQGSQNSHVLNALIEEDYLRRITGFQRMCGLAEVDIEIFCDAERQHIKEGVVLVDEENGAHFNLRCPRTVVQLLFGRKVPAEDLLKISQTSLEVVMTEESLRLRQSQSSGRRRTRAKPSRVDVEEKREKSPSLLVARPADNNGAQRVDIKELLEVVRKERSGSNGCSSVSKDSVKRKRSLGESEGESDTWVDEEQAVEEADQETQGTGDKLVQPYSQSSQLEYLDDCFQALALMIRANAARLKDDMKKEGTRVSQWEGGGDVKHGKRELQAKLRVLEARVQSRVDATRRFGLPLPRLEVIAERLGLDVFEKKMIVLLMGVTISPVVKTLISTLDKSQYVEDACTVGQALSILCPDFNSQIVARRFFYRSGKLLSNGIVSLYRPRWHQGTGDLTDQRISLDRRVLDFSVGLDTEINELVEGSDLYEPKVELSQVVLPEGQIDTILEQCRAYDTFRKYRNDRGLQEILSYGNGLVIMLCGKSGTGKTMTVNAIAKDLGKKVLLVDFGSLSGRKDGTEADADLRGLFREAHMNNAILFFDECENVFRSRNQGGDRLLNSLLTEIERHEGIVFLATNRPYELDEAMHRRITAVIEYRPPDHAMRTKIWERLLGMTSDPSLMRKINLADDVDVASLAVKFELTGGFIKNAVLSALLSAIARDKLNPVLCQQDLRDGCRLQMRGSLSTKAFEHISAPSEHFQDMCLPKPILAATNSILRFESARSSIYGAWAMGVSQTQRASICLFAGASGSGKRTLCHALAKELGRAVKVLHVAEFITTSISDTMYHLNGNIQDAKLADAVLILDGFENVVVEDSSSEATLRMNLLLTRVLDALHTFPGLVLLVCHIDDVQNLSLKRSLAVKLFNLMRFNIPPHSVRAELWRHLMPKKAPLDGSVNFNELGRRFELNSGSIQSAIAKACAEAVARGEGRLDRCEVRQQDLLLAGEHEIAKVREGNFELVSKLFV